MKRYLTSITIVAATVAAGLLNLAADDLPKAQAFLRYEPMLNRSPFAVATAVAAPAATPNFAKDLYIANGARTADGDLITLASTTDKNFKKYLSTKAPFDGYSIANIEWSDRVGETKVTIGKDGQTATLSFNQALISQAAANFVPPPPQQQQPPQAMLQSGPGVPPVPQYNSNVVKPAPNGVPPAAPPRVRGVIPRNPNGAAVPAQSDAAQQATEKEL